MSNTALLSHVHRKQTMTVKSVYPWGERENSLSIIELRSI